MSTPYFRLRELEKRINKAEVLSSFYTVALVRDSSDPDFELNMQKAMEARSTLQSLAAKRSALIAKCPTSRVRRFLWLRFGLYGGRRDSSSTL